MKNLCKGEIFIFNLFLIHIPWATTHTKHSSITRTNKNAFQQDAHRRLVDHIPACIAGSTCPGVYLPGGDLPRGVPDWGDGGVPAGGVYLPRGSMYLPMGVYLPGLVYLPGGICPGRPVRGSEPTQGGVPARGVHLPGGYPPCEKNDRQVQKYYLGPNFVLRAIIISKG